MTINPLFQKLQWKNVILLPENVTESYWDLFLFGYLRCTRWKSINPEDFLSIGCLQSLHSSRFSTALRGKKNHPEINMVQCWARHKDSRLKHITWYWEAFSKSQQTVCLGASTTTTAATTVWNLLHRLWAGSLETWSCGFYDKTTRAKASHSLTLKQNSHGEATRKQKKWY